MSNQVAIVAWLPENPMHHPQQYFPDLISNQSLELFRRNLARILLFRIRG
ncbi:hypothetical protein JFT81_00970 [Pseudomonas sp. TH43]|nr:hypothetical protein [Pseudomonas sp. TH43]MBK5373206.1 hypothetical protein [Pseudomonas sp. TH43]